MEKKQSLIKKIGLFVANTSSALLDGFLSDSAEERLQAQISQEMVQALETAAIEKSIVVLQVQDPYEKNKVGAVTGWITTKKIKGNNLAIKLKTDGSLQMIPLTAIQKVSVLSYKRGPQKSIAR